MGDWSRLYIGKYPVLAWKYELPPVNDPIINFIFKPEDKEIEEDTEKISYNPRRF